MGNKRKKKNRSTETPVAETDSTSRNVDASASTGRWIAVALLVLGAGVFLYALTSKGPASEASTPRASSTATVASAPRRDPGQSRSYRYFENPEAAHPLPVTLPPSQFQNAGIAHAYEVAKEIPEVLAQQPCLCGCDNTSDDHRSLLDCYIDEHASSCMICMKEAVFTEQMTKAGKSADWIRDAILRREFSDVNIGN